MKKSRFKRWFTILDVLAQLMILSLGLAWNYRIWSVHDFGAYLAMRKESPPVWRDLENGRIHAGQDVEEVIAATKPSHVERFGEFVCLGYGGGFNGVSITSRNGRLIMASTWSCTWQRVFFDESTQADRDAYDQAYEAYIRPIMKRVEEQRKKWEEEEKKRAADEAAQRLQNPAPPFPPP